MNENNGSFFINDGELMSSDRFDDSFLSTDHYIYEVFRVIDGIPLFLEDHLARLEKTCLLAGHCENFDMDLLKSYIGKLITACNLKEGNIKIIIRYISTNKDLFLIYITEHQYPDARQFEQGVAVALQKGTRSIPNAKIMDADLRMQANAIKSEKDVYETLLVDSEKCITEGSRSNVFFIRNGKVITPPVSDVLPGITRKHILEVCNELRLPVVEEKVLARSLVVMEAIFISGTSRKVLPVNRVDELEFDPSHPLTRQIQEAFNQHIIRYLQSRS